MLPSWWSARPGFLAACLIGRDTSQQWRADHLRRRGRIRKDRYIGLVVGDRPTAGRTMLVIRSCAGNPGGLA
jgi:hypothetical protein